jgi:branched-chain amino acid transport system ATP-binding protein
LRPTAGRILVEDDDITDWPAHRRARRGLCLVADGSGVFPHLTVEEHLRLFGSAADALGVFPALAGRERQQAGTLSGGEQQMLALLRAEVQRPDVLLLDEVCSGLATHVVDGVLASARARADAGSTVLLVEQYARRALAVADVVYVLRQGVVIFHGGPDELGVDDLMSRYADQTSTR